MKKPKKGGYPEPPIGTVFYEAGFKQEEPRAPIIITWVYCGKVISNGQEFHLLVEFSVWWGMTGRQLPIEGKDGLKIPTLEQLYDGREAWGDIVRWVKECGKDWRKAMKKQQG